MFAEIAKQNLHSVNCHLHTETSDFLGGLRPVRSHSEVNTEDLEVKVQKDQPIWSYFETRNMFAK